MSIDTLDQVVFDDVIAVALAEAAAAGTGGGPRPEVRHALMARIARPAVPTGFSFAYATESEWVPHPITGIRMKTLSINRESGYATMVFDVAPGTRFPAHHHSGAEECFVIAGSLYTCGRRLEAGDFVHADAGTDHGELWTEEGCRVLLVVTPEDYFPAAPSE